MAEQKSYLSLKGQGWQRMLQWTGLVLLVPVCALFLIGTIGLLIDGESAAYAGAIVFVITFVPCAKIIANIMQRSQAQTYAKCFENHGSHMISTNELSSLTGKRNSLEQVRKLLMKGYLQGISIDIESGTIALREATVGEKSSPVKCPFCGASLQKNHAQSCCAYCGSLIQTK